MSYFATENAFLPTVSGVISVTKLYDIIYIFTSNAVNNVEIFNCDENFISREQLYLDPNSGSDDYRYFVLVAFALCKKLLAKFTMIYHNLKSYKLSPH